MTDEFFLQEHSLAVEEELLRCAVDAPALSCALRRQTIGAAMTAHRRAWFLERTQVAAAAVAFFATGMLLSGHYLIQFGIQQEPTAMVSQDAPSRFTTDEGDRRLGWDDGIPTQTAMYARAIGSDEWSLVEISNDYRYRNLHILKATFWE